MCVCVCCVSVAAVCLVFFVCFFAICLTIAICYLSLFAFCYLLCYLLFVFICYLSVYFLFSLFLLFFLFSLVALCVLQALGFPARNLVWASSVGAQTPGCWTAREFPDPGNINCCALSQRYLFQHQDLAQHSYLWAPVLETSCQTTSKTEKQPHTSADRLSKIILSSQTPQTTLDAALSFRGKRLSSTHQSAGTSLSHQEAYTSPWTKLTHQGADNRRKRNYDPAA